MVVQRNKINYGTTKVSRRDYQKQFSYDDPSTWRRADWDLVAKGDPRYEAYWKGNPYNYNSGQVYGLTSARVGSSQIEATRQNLIEGFQFDYDSEAAQSERLKEVGINPDLMGLDQASDNNMSGNQHVDPSDSAYRRFEAAMSGIGQVLEIAKTGADIYGSVTDTDIKQNEADANMYDITARQMLETGNSYTPRSHRQAKRQRMALQDILSSPDFRKSLFLKGQQRQSALNDILVKNGAFDKVGINRMVDYAAKQQDIFELDQQVEENRNNFLSGYYGDLNGSVKAEAENANNQTTIDIAASNPGELQGEALAAQNRAIISNSENQIQYNETFSGESRANFDKAAQSQANRLRKFGIDSAEINYNHNSAYMGWQDDNLASFKEAAEPIINNIKKLNKQLTENKMGPGPRTFIVQAIKSNQRQLSRLHKTFLNGGGDPNADKDFFGEITGILKILK